MRPGLAVYATPSMLLTMKTSSDINPFPSSATRTRFDLLGKMFKLWQRSFGGWKSDYLHHVQHSKKWQEHSRNLNLGDLVLVKDDNAMRNEWPTGIVHRTFPSSDGLVMIRKLEIAVVKDDMKRVLCVRPVSDLLTLFEVEE